MASSEIRSNGNQASPKSGSSAVASANDSDAPKGVADLLVWIDQDLCTGDGICTDHAPEVFQILEDGIAYCVENGRVFNDPGGSAELARVPPALEAAVIASANECPGECIFIDVAEVESQPS